MMQKALKYWLKNFILSITETSNCSLSDSGYLDWNASPENGGEHQEHIGGEIIVV